MKLYIIGLFAASSVAFSSCDLLNSSGANPVTTEEVVKGLKTALTLGTDSATSRLNMTDGYLEDVAVKIILPPDAQVIYKYKDNEYFKAAGVSNAINDGIGKTIKGMNRAAEAAAKDAKPIFVDAITNLSISQGWDILNGKNPSATKSGTETAGFDSSAATNFLKSTTFTQLVGVFSKPMKEQLDKDLGVGISATKAWEGLTTSYNTGVKYYNQVNNISGGILDGLKSTHEDLQPINVDLASYATGKALDGLFLKVGEEETKIRRNPLAWASDIIERVFTEGVKQITGK